MSDILNLTSKMLSERNQTQEYTLVKIVLGFRGGLRGESDRGSDRQRAQLGFWGAGIILFLDLGDGHMGLFSLWKFIKVYVYDMHTLCDQEEQKNLRLTKKVPRKWLLAPYSGLS